MTSYAYRAARSDGIRVAGVVEATNVAEASAILMAQGLFPVAVTKAAPTPIRLTGRSRAALARALGGLATVLRAGLPLDRAIAITVEGGDSGSRAFWSGVRDRVVEGSALSEALRRSGQVPDLVVGLVRAGETHGRLADALTTAASHLERDQALRSFLLGALTYPGIVAVVGSVSVGVILFLVIPRFTMLLGTQVAALPPSSRVLLGTAALVGNHVGAVVAVTLLGAIGAVSLWAHGAVRGIGARWLLRVPIVGPVVWGLAAARVCGAVETLLEGGVSALEALDAGADVAGNRDIAGRLALTRESVNQGQRLARALAAHAVLPARAAQLALFGEESGKLGQMLREAADIEERDARQRVAALIRLLEPGLIVVFGALVAFVAAALLQAVYSIRPGL